MTRRAPNLLLQIANSLGWRYKLVSSVGDSFLGTCENLVSSEGSVRRIFEVCPRYRAGWSFFAALVHHFPSATCTESRPYLLFDHASCVLVRAQSYKFVCRSRSAAVQSISQGAALSDLRSLNNYCLGSLNERSP